MPKPSTLKGFGSRLKSRRESKGLTQADLGKEIGVTWKRISAYENGADLSLETAHKLANCLKIPLTDLIEPKDSTNSDAKVIENPELLNRILAVWGTFNEDQRRLLAQNAEAFAARINPTNQSSKPVSKHKKAGT